MDLYNNKLTYRTNKLLRKLFIIPKLRQLLHNSNFTILCNNCNGGIISHELGQRFNSPTVNMYFFHDHFIRFCEDLEYYLGQELKPCANPNHKPTDIEYPIMNIGEGDKKLELHFLHYASEQEAISTWNRRLARINRDNMFFLFTHFDAAEEEWVKRFDNLPFKHKASLVNTPFPQYKSAIYIPGYESVGLGNLSLFKNLKGGKRMDGWDFVRWLNKES